MAPLDSGCKDKDYFLIQQYYQRKIFFIEKDICLRMKWNRIKELSL